MRATLGAVWVLSLGCTAVDGPPDASADALDPACMTSAPGAGGRATSLVFAAETTPARLAVEVSGVSIAVPLEGSVRLDPACFSDLACSSSIADIDLGAAGPIDIAGHVVSDVYLLTGRRIPIELVVLGPGRASVHATAACIPRSGPYLSFTLDGSRSGVALLVEGVSGEIDTSARSYRLDVALSAEGASGTLELEGALANLPPTADAGPDRTVACADPSGASLHFSAAASTDPDGAVDIARCYWFVDAEILERAGCEIDVVLGVGAHHARLVVTDTAGHESADAATITVEDPDGRCL